MKKGICRWEKVLTLSPHPHSDDTVAEIAPLTRRILHTKSWNEGLSAKDISIPPQYREVEGDRAENVAVAETPSTDTTNKVTRSEQVWGGKPWKTNVMDLGGEILCNVVSSD